MAEQQDTGQERTEQATPKKLADAREKGNVVRSRELTTALILLGGIAGVSLSAEHLFAGLTGVLKQGFDLRRAQIFDPYYLHNAIVEAGLTALIALAPILTLLTVIALFAPIALGGWSFNAGASSPKFNRLNPITGIKNVFGMRGIVESVKALAKFVLILGFGMTALYQDFASVSALGLRGTGPALAEAGHTVLKVFMFSTLATMLIAALDVPYQIWEHGKKLRMTRQEVKDETKQQEGSPELRGRIRNLQQEMANRRMMEEVPKADVIITNPEHYAVAIRFDAETMRAPVVVAKGMGEIAAKIREIASLRNVTVISAPPLARSIYHTTKLQREIPAGLYVAVAQVLAYVFHLKRDSARPRPLAVAELPIPPELQY